MTDNGNGIIAPASRRAVERSKEAAEELQRRLETAHWFIEESIGALSLKESKIAARSKFLQKVSSDNGWMLADALMAAEDFLRNDHACTSMAEFSRNARIYQQKLGNFLDNTMPNMRATPRIYPDEARELLVNLDNVAQMISERSGTLSRLASHVLDAGERPGLGNPDEKIAIQSCMTLARHKLANIAAKHGITLPNNYSGIDR